MNDTGQPRLFPERESVALIRSTLEQHGFDLAHEALRTDYLISPFPNLETFLPQLHRIEPLLQLLLRLYSVGETVALEGAEAALGRDVLEANLASGLLQLNETGTGLSTRGLQIVSRLGQYFVVSTSRAYPGFDPSYADVYLGPESYTVANYLQRRAGRLSSSGKALDLCTGSGIAAQSLAAVRRGVIWTGIDLSEQAVNAAAFNATLNEMGERYRPLIGDLYEPIGDQRFGLIVANPPFVPVPTAVEFPVYGDGGEDGLSVLRPVLAGLASHLTPSGRAIIYAEGLGDASGPFVVGLLEEIARSNLTVGLTILSTIGMEQALFTIGRMLSVQTPSRLDELSKWQRLFRDQSATRYMKFIIEAREGQPGVTVRSIAAP